MAVRKRPTEPAIILAALLLFLLLGSFTAGAQEAEPPSQQGLPPELVIPGDQPLSQQLVVYRALAQTAAKYNPKPSPLSGCTQMFGGGSQNGRYFPVSQIAAHTTELLNMVVRTEGIYERRGDSGVMLSEGAEVKLELAGGVAPEGFDAAGGKMDGMPVMAKGTVESDNGAALIRAQLVVPSEMIAQLRVARILELQGDYLGAVDAYQKVAGNASMARLPLGAFARIRAAELAFDELRDQKLATKNYSAAWQPYSVEDKQGQPVYHTWQPASGDGWAEVPARQAIAPRLQELNAKHTAYQIVDFFVKVAGGNRALGVILMALVVRIAIYPLTKKQLDSSRRMQAIQPQIKALQKKLGDDKQKFQEEFWKLCKENKCNPLGGCLPLLVQMPILIFLYRGIRDYIVQFDQAGFLWMRNLAQPDITLLIAYTISMIAFQKMSTMSQPAMDAQQQQQQKMMAYMMPIMFFFLFQSFPAAFILYWLASNLSYISEQWFFLRRGGHATVTDSPAVPAPDADKPKAGFASSMLKAINPQKVEKEEERPSYHEKRKQEKGGKRGKRR